MDQQRLAHARDCDHCGSAMPAGWWAWQFGPSWYGPADGHLLLCCRSCAEPYELHEDLLALDVESLDGLNDLIRDVDRRAYNAERLVASMAQVEGPAARDDERKAADAGRYLRRQYHNLMAIRRTIVTFGIEPRSASARIEQLAILRATSRWQAVPA